MGKNRFGFKTLFRFVFKLTSHLSDKIEVRNYGFIFCIKIIIKNYGFIFYMKSIIENYGFIFVLKP